MVEQADIEIDEEEIENIQQDKKKSGKSKASDLFEQRQKQYLKGKIVTKSISSTSGKVIIKEGVEITDEIFETAKANGKLVELVMNNAEK